MTPQSPNGTKKYSKRQEDYFSQSEVRLFAFIGLMFLAAIIYTSVNCIYFLAFYISQPVSEISITPSEVRYIKVVILSIIIGLLLFLGAQSCIRSRWKKQPAYSHPKKVNGQCEVYVHLRMTADSRRSRFLCMKAIHKEITELLQKKTPVVVVSSHLLTEDRHRRAFIEMVIKKGVPDGWHIISDNVIVPTSWNDCLTISTSHYLFCFAPVALRRKSAAIRIVRSVY
ncbi:hypothetical protein [Buttiauxella agrestis]|uniref:hypothetical protein n=1 Tax=Buttiauxella agrestis TaxID=82977 RepID=UPI0039765BFD